MPMRHLIALACLMQIFAGSTFCSDDPPAPCPNQEQPVIGLPIDNEVITSPDLTHKFIVRFPCRFSNYDGDVQKAEAPFVQLNFYEIIDGQDIGSFHAILPFVPGPDGEEASYAVGDVAFPHEGQYRSMAIAVWPGATRWSWGVDTTITVWIGDKALRDALAGTGKELLESSPAAGGGQLGSAARKLGALNAFQTPTPFPWTVGNFVTRSGSMPASGESIVRTGRLIFPSSLAVRSVKSSPASPLADQSFELFVEFENRGKEEIAPGALFTVSCDEKPANADCPITTEARHVEFAVPANRSGTVVARVKGRASAAGPYRLKVRPLGGTADTFGEVRVVVRPIVVMPPQAPTPTIRIHFPPTPTPTPRINLPGGGPPPK